MNPQNAVILFTEMPSPDLSHSILQKYIQQQNQIPTYVGSIDMLVYVYSKEIPAFHILPYVKTGPASYKPGINTGNFRNHNSDSKTTAQTTV